jgi:hypothetical protein
MNSLRAIVFACLALGFAACRSSDPDQRYKAWELGIFKQEAKSHEQVILVCIYTNHFVRMPAGHYHRLEGEGVVVRSYKGDWRVEEPIALRHQVESAPEGWTPPVGFLQYYLLNAHTNEPIWVDVGEAWDYKPQFERALELMFPRGGRR